MEMGAGAAYRALHRPHSNDGLHWLRGVEFSVQTSALWRFSMMAAGLVLCGFSMLLMVLFIASFGEGVIEGLATPFIRHNDPKDSTRYINFTYSF